MKKSEFQALIKYCFQRGKNTVQAKQWLDKYCLDSALLETTVKRWYADFKLSHTHTNEAECSGHPNSANCPRKHQKTPQTRFGLL